jgi:hypothetical protein
MQFALLITRICLVLNTCRIRPERCILVFRGQILLLYAEVMPVGGLACAPHRQLLFWAPPLTKRLDNIVFYNSNSKYDGFSKETTD